MSALSSHPGSPEAMAHLDLRGPHDAFRFQAYGEARPSDKQLEQRSDL